ncbi:parB, chromosome partitioning protein, ParB family [Nostoc flagelliforme CCNUN1]|uniref:ParB, chromosome partitioning protein, ParB family n=1 Tax=Nostoc flagelliforme CCNUN1 TaxID=2038116 RepID=A0A2K8SFK5_9NOSO|nr:ParB/RepB/Spo0J family partition protein [Nostoc flagelliforme]AUB34231.1 parB, chromosome partitioning protein, ParB family [Nostoc flagelliforme CCNUN1]
MIRRKQTDKPFGGQITTPPPAPWLSSPDGNPAAATETTIKLSDIVLPQHQPRRYFDPQALKELVSSVKQHGILQPLLVRPIGGGKYELVAGERRYRAGQEAELEVAPVVVRELSDDQAFQLALIENLQREDLNPIEETEGILHLLAIRLHCDVEAVKSLLYRMKNAHSKGEQPSKSSLNESSKNVSPNPDNPQSEDNVSEHLAEKNESSKNVSPNLDEEQSNTVQEVFLSLGLMNWLSFITTRLPLLNLPEEILMALRSGQLEYTKAQVLARVRNNEIRKKLLSEAIANYWSLSQIKEKITAWTNVELTPDSKATNQIPDRLQNITQRIKKRQLWKEKDKQKQLVNLLNKLEALLGDE